MRTRAAEDAEYIYPGATRDDAAKGRGLFTRHCAECHGNTGEGTKAPALHNQEFLSAASNGYLLGTITLGRTGTPMPDWGRPSKSHVLLTGQQREDIVAWLRSLQYARLRFIAPDG
jgi:cytochrome c oxidase cbb3-type subunit 3